jgi:hypothetical protein
MDMTKLLKQWQIEYVKKTGLGIKKQHTPEMLFRVINPKGYLLMKIDVKKLETKRRIKVFRLQSL